MMTTSPGRFSSYYKSLTLIVQICILYYNPRHYHRMYVYMYVFIFAYLSPQQPSHSCWLIACKTIIVNSYTVNIRVETGLGQSIYVSGSGGSLFVWVMWVTRSNEITHGQYMYILKMVTMDSEQYSEHLSTSHCHSREQNSELLVIETFLKEQHEKQSSMRAVWSHV